MPTQIALRTLTFLTVIALTATGSRAQNLHRKYGPSWDCGYISYGLPYKELCEACEAKGQEFEQIGNSGRCVDKPNAIDGGRRSLRETIHERLLEKNNGRSGDEDDDQETKAPVVISPPPPPHPSYGKSGISSRKGGTIRSNQNATVDPETAAREKRQKTYQFLKPALAQMQAGKWMEAQQVIDEIFLSTHDSHSTRHALWLKDITSGEMKLDKLLENEVEWRSKSDVPIGVVLELLSDPLETSEQASDVAKELPTFSRIDAALKKRWQKINSMAKAAQISVNLQDLSFKGYGAELERCREMGGIIVDDIVKGEDRLPRRFCTVRPISRQEIQELIREYEEAMQQ